MFRVIARYSQRLLEKMESRLFIAGRYVDAAKSARFADIEPATERELAEIACAGADDVNRAVVAAREAAEKLQKIDPERYAKLTPETSGADLPF